MGGDAESSISSPQPCAPELLPHQWIFTHTHLIIGSGFELIGYFRSTVPNGRFRQIVKRFLIGGQSRRRCIERVEWNDSSIDSFTINCFSFFLILSNVSPNANIAAEVSATANSLANEAYILNSESIFSLSIQAVVAQCRTEKLRSVEPTTAKLVRFGSLLCVRKKAVHANMKAELFCTTNAEGQNKIDEAVENTSHVMN